MLVFTFFWRRGFSASTGRNLIGFDQRPATLLSNFMVIFPSMLSLSALPDIASLACDHSLGDGIAYGKRRRESQASRLL